MEFTRNGISDRALEIADRVEAFVRDVVVPFEGDARVGFHGPSDEMALELKARARAAGAVWSTEAEDGRLEMTTAALPKGPEALKLFDLSRWADTAAREACS